jgi:hypothetical protein
MTSKMIQLEFIKTSKMSKTSKKILGLTLSGIPEFESE